MSVNPIVKARKAKTVDHRYEALSLATWPTPESTGRSVHRFHRVSGNECSQVCIAEFND